MNEQQTVKEPGLRFTAKEITRISLFAVLTAALAQVSIPLPFTPIPLTLGLVAVYMSGMLLEPKHALFSQICYLALGAIGIPVFSNFRGGIGALFGVTGGYLLVYPAMAWLIATALHGDKEKVHYGKAIAAMLIAQFLLYTGGTLWLSLMTGTGFMASLTMAVFPFIPIDLAKMAFCVAVILPLRKRIMA